MVQTENRQGKDQTLESDQGYRSIYAPVGEVMTYLRENNLTSMSIAAIMKKRINLSSQEGVSSDIANFWYMDSFGTTDCCLYMPDGSIGIELDSRSWRNIDTQTKLHEGGLPIDLSYRERLEIPLLTQEERMHYARGQALPPNQILDNKIARILARHPDEVPSKFAEDRNLLPEYIKLVSSKLPFEYGWIMPIFANSFEDIPVMKQWSIDGVGILKSSMRRKRYDISDLVGKELFLTGHTNVAVENPRKDIS